MNVLAALAQSWRADAVTLRQCGAEEAARTSELRADQLEEALRVSDREIVTLAEAALEGGYSKRRIRQMVAEGKLTNVGESGVPRFRRGDVPTKPTKSTSAGGFDPAAEARSIAGTS